MFNQAFFRPQDFVIHNFTADDDSKPALEMIDEPKREIGDDVVTLDYHFALGRSELAEDGAQSMTFHIMPSRTDLLELRRERK
jgi:hypothetical protein